MFYSFSSWEFTSPWTCLVSASNFVFTFIISTFTLTMSNLDLFFLTTDVYLSSLLCSTLNSISLFIFSFICCPGCNCSSPAINITAVIIPKQPSVCTSHYIYIMTVHQQHAFLRPKKLILALYIPICTPISHYFLHICSQSHSNCNPLH